MKDYFHSKLKVNYVLKLDALLPSICKIEAATGPRDHDRRIDAKRDQTFASSKPTCIILLCQKFLTYSNI